MFILFDISLTTSLYVCVCVCVCVSLEGGILECCLAAKSIGSPINTCLSVLIDLHT